MYLNRERKQIDLKTNIEHLYQYSVTRLAWREST